MIGQLLFASAVILCTDPPAEFPEIPGWSCSPESTVYTPSNLWDLIDGAADLFLEYRFEDLHLARYTNTKGGEVRIEIYRHATGTDAFGIYAAERSTEYTFIKVGTQGYRAEGIVNLFCGEYYVKLSTMDTAGSAQEAMVDIGRRVTVHLRRTCLWPAELRLLPARGRIANSEQYVRRGLLGHEFLINAFSAGYRDGGRCFIIRCSSAADAEGIVQKYRGAVNAAASNRPDGSVELHDPHNGTVVLRRIGADLAGVYGAAEPKAREVLLTAAVEALTGR